MVKDSVWGSVDKADLPTDAKVFTTAWACRKKANDTL